MQVAETRCALVEGEDFYLEGAAMVFTSRFHLRRGYCCENNCRHCPYRETMKTNDQLEGETKDERPPTN